MLKTKWVELIDNNAKGGKTAIESTYTQTFVRKALNIRGSDKKQLCQDIVA